MAKIKWKNKADKEKKEKEKPKPKQTEAEYMMAELAELKQRVSMLEALLADK